MAAPAPPAPRPAGTPAPTPRARPATKTTGGKGRQIVAFRFAAVATSALLLVPVVAGVTEMHMHGFDFFVFRAAGTGETAGSGLQEDQGPGQPDAPKATPSAKPTDITPTHGTHKTITVHKRS
jgi:hypothetical protein